MAHNRLEDPAHPAVPQDGHVVDAVRARDHPRDQRGDLQTGVRALVRGYRQEPICQLLQTDPVGQRNHRDQPGRGQQVRFVEHRAAHWTSMRCFHLRGALRDARTGS